MKCEKCGGLNCRTNGSRNGVVRIRCNDCGKSRSIKSSQVRKKGVANPPEDIPQIFPSDILALEREVAKAKEGNRLDKVKIHFLTEELQKNQQTIAILSALGDNKVDKGPFKISPSLKGKNEATAVICLSDLHLEESVDPNTVNGLNEYNPQIAEKRFKKLIENALKLTNLQANSVNIKDVIIWLGGDIISGYIHQELVESNFMSPVEAILFADRLISWGIDFFLNNSKYNLFIPTSNGNHGRTTQKIQISTYAANSFEFLLYKNLERRYANEKRVRFQVAEGYLNFVDVYNMKIRFHHGDSVKYHGGSGGLYVPINKSIAAWDSSIKVDLDVMGHFHQLTCDRKFIVNGSMIGYGPYSLSIKASPEPPQQAFFLLDKERNRRTVFAPIFVD